MPDFIKGGLLFACIFYAALLLAQKGTNQQDVTDNKIVIYQMMTRLFGNKNTTNKFYGSIKENGAGKFNDITNTALDSLKALGISHVWYTGVVAHATMTDYTAFGIRVDDPDVVKGRAGSPYAVKDYYDVDPDLAVDINHRMQEYEALIKRTHMHGLKVLMDFVPNHVARTYYAANKPKGVIGFGENDDTAIAFNPKNDFYYISYKKFIVPSGTNAGGSNFHSPLKDGEFPESPAKATGNNVFNEHPSIDDWYETVKLNYGVDYLNNQKTYFNPIPPVWEKMRNILQYWAKKGVDGFRCDMAEMVPVEFWHWVIPEVKKINPALIFIGEAYDTTQYLQYFTKGNFDFLYDKVGLYDGLKRLIRNDSGATVEDISKMWNTSNKPFSSRFLRFLENHDEQRIASGSFAGDPFLTLPAMVVTATLSTSPVMIYFGQEVGEKGADAEGFGGDDGRTTIFDYWGVPAHQQWMNSGKFDGGQLSEKQKRLRIFYKKLLNIAASNVAIRKGIFKEVKSNNNLNARQYAYWRITDKQKVLIVANFDRKRTLNTLIPLPDTIGKNNFVVKELLSSKKIITDAAKGIPVAVKPSDAWIVEIK